MPADVHMPVSLDDIIVPEGRREVVQAQVKKLAASIEEIGLKHPITVRRERGGEKYVLVAGLHRMEACRKLGREHVPAVITSMTNDEARLWEISENLHRAELTKLERDEQIAEWIKITERVSRQSDAKPQGGRPEGGVRAAARDLEISEPDARRAVQVASLSDEAKEAAREHGLDDNRAALLKAAAEPPERQAAKVIQLASEHPKDEYELSAEWRRGFERHWNKAPSAKDREWAKEWIDRPIMSERFG